MFVFVLCMCIKMLLLNVKPEYCFFLFFDGFLKLVHLKISCNHFFTYNLTVDLYKSERQHDSMADFFLLLTAVFDNRVTIELQLVPFFSSSSSFFLIFLKKSKKIFSFYVLFSAIHFAIACHCNHIKINLLQCLLQLIYVSFLLNSPFFATF